MANLWFLIIGSLTIGISPDVGEEPPPLANALWIGELQIQVEGPLYTQYLANRTEKDLIKPVVEEEGGKRKPRTDFVQAKNKGEGNTNRVIGFVKEKGEFNVSYTLVIRFLLNALGEFSLVAIDDMKGHYLVSRETRHVFDEEKLIEEKVHRKQRFIQKVQVSETTTTNVIFEKDGSYLGADFNFGNLRFQPSGRMHKKGAIQVIADLKIPYTGEGTVQFVHERQPPDEEKDPAKGTVADMSKTFILPLTFNFTIAHRKEAVTGTFPVEVKVANPFPSEDEKQKKKQVYRNLWKVRGDYTLTPLFNVKTKKR